VLLGSLPISLSLSLSLLLAHLNTELTIVS
jgi:hypothetical protein